jgi:hypothetical protein
MLVGETEFVILLGRHIIISGLLTTQNMRIVRHAEIGDFHDAVCRVKQISRLDISVYDTLVVDYRRTAARSVG